MTIIRNTPTKKVHTGLLLTTLLTIFFCSEDYNPFTDPANANVYITSWSFSGKDSVSLYETGTFTILVSARREVDSFSLSIPKNRYWTDTVIKTENPLIPLDGGPYHLDVSYYDTGLQRATITTYRSNGERLPQDFYVNVYNPLWQEDVSGEFGDTVVFYTTNVPDEKKGIRYHWNLGGNWHVASNSSRFPAVVSLFSPEDGQGSLWMSDLHDSCRTPTVNFSYTFDDHSKPVVTYYKKELSDDTIFTADAQFAFQVYITDAGNAEVESCTVNYEPFDYINHSSHVYTKLFRNLQQESPKSVLVYAMDNKKFRNTTTRTFTLCFDSTVIKSPSVTILFERPAADGIVTSQSSFRVSGIALSSGIDTMRLLCSINDSIASSVHTVIGAGEWSWLVPLTSATTVVVSAFAPDNRLLASALRVINYDADAPDTVRPEILEVSTGDLPLGSQFYTDKTVLPLKIVAIDDGSGLDYLSINEIMYPADTQSAVWEVSSGTLEHNRNGNPVNIAVVDKKGNRTERTVILFKNSRPELVNALDFPVPCCAEDNYKGLLYYKDADNDQVDIDTVKVPRGMTVSKEGIVTWEPWLQSGSEEHDTLIVMLKDGFEHVLLEPMVFTVRPCSPQNSSLKFITTADSFPSVLQAGLDRLNVKLKVDTTGVRFTPRFNAVFIDNGRTLLGNNDTTGLVKWSPAPADTGSRKLMITAGDGFSTYDTLIPVIQVVPKNQYPCTLSVRFTGLSTIPGVLDMFTHAEPETLYFTINDQDDPLTEQYTVEVALGTLRSVQTLNRKIFFVAIEPDSTKSIEILNVSVSDSTNTSSSLQFIIQHGGSTGNLPPQVDGGSVFPVYNCAGIEYIYRIHTADPDGDPVQIITLWYPSGMDVLTDGTITWTPPMNSLGPDSLVFRLFDGKDSSQIYVWKTRAVDCDNPPPAVSFKTAAEDFPAVLQVDIDNLYLQLATVEGTGVQPFNFKAVLDNGLSILDNSTGLIDWAPSDADTGSRKITVTVSDLFGTGDTLTPEITIVPRNSHRCSLTYIYTGTTLPSGQLYLESTGSTDSIHFTINDPDHPLTERYVVSVKRRTVTVMNLAGSDRTFALPAAPGSTGGNPHSGLTPGPVDTILVTVNDSTGYTDTSLVIIRHPLDSPDDVSQLSLHLNASDGVTTYGNRVSRWSYGTGYFSSITQWDAGRQPIRVQNAVNGLPAVLFDDVTDNGDDGLFNTTLQWADMPFTVFIVFSPRSMVSNDRTALVTSNTINGFSLGFSCNGNLGIHNDVIRKCCGEQDCRSTDLHVSPQQWYIAAYQSSLGITADGTIRVQARLNGTPASQIVELSTSSTYGLAVGTGSSAMYNGSFDGWIASVIIYARALTGDDLFLVERYLAGQYGITVR